MTMKIPQTCLSAELLRQLSHGELSPAELKDVEDHVSDCERCRRLLEVPQSDPQWQDEIVPILRNPLEPPYVAGDHDERGSEGESLESILRLLGPTDDPHMLGRIGSYEVVSVIGRGGMGVVFKAYEGALNRFVAIKMLLPHLAASGAARKRFAREGQAAAAVIDDNVMPIYSVAEWQGVPYLVTQYSRGVTLQKRIQDQGPLELKEILRIGMQTARGLAAAHAQGLVHRDAKPSNIMLDGTVERALLTDFGLARAVDDASITRTGIIAGTPQYMSPEQARGGSVDARSDLFGLGCVLYAMCTGRPPFRADSSYAILRMITDDEPRSIREINPDIPEWLCLLISRLMAKSPDARFGNALEVAALLEQCLAHVQQPTSVSLPASLVPRATGRRSVFNVTQKGLIVMLGTIGMTLLGMVLWQTTEAPNIGGQWTSDEWGTVVLEAKQPGQYEATFTGSDKDKPAYDITDIPVVTEGGFGTAPVLTESKTGTIQLKWSRVERRFNGTWRKGINRSGKMSLRLVDNEIRGAWTTSKDAQKGSDSPRLGDLSWQRAPTSATPLVTMELMPGIGVIQLKGSTADVNSAVNMIHGIADVAQDKQTNPSGNAHNVESPGSIDRQNARSVVEGYVGSALAGDVAKAAALAKNSAADPKHIKEIPEFLNVQRLKIQTVYVNDPAKPTRALATSEAVKLDEAQKQPDGQRDGFMVFTLEFTDGKWFVIDIDFESESGAEKELKRFLDANRNSVGLPPLKTTSEAAKSATGLPETKSLVTLSEEKPVAKPDWVVAWDFNYTLLHQRYAAMRISSDGKMEAIFPEWRLLRTQLSPDEISALVALVAKNPNVQSLPIAKVAEYSQAVSPKPELDDAINKVNVRSEIVAVIHKGELLELDLDTSESAVVTNQLWKLVGLAAIGGSEKLPKLVDVANSELKRKYPDVSKAIDQTHFRFAIVDHPSGNISVWFNFNIDPGSKDGQVVLRIPQDGQPSIEQVVAPKGELKSPPDKAVKPTARATPNLPKLPHEAYTRTGVPCQKLREEDAKRPGGELMGDVVESKRGEDPLVLGMRVASDAKWNIGGQTRVELVVRNVSGSDVKFQQTPRADNGLSVVAIDKDGKVHHAEIAQFDSWLVLNHLRLPDSHVVMVKSFTLRFDPEKRGVLEYGVAAFHLPPGDYTLRCKWNDARPEVAHEGEWTGELVSAELKFKLAAAEETPPASETPKTPADMEPRDPD